MLKTLVFDFDGTLVDSVDSIWCEYQRVMEEMDLRRVSHREFTRVIGKTWEDILATLWPEMDPLEFTSRYKVNSECFKLVDGAGEALRELAKDYTLVIMTSRGEETLYKHLRGSGLDEGLFKAVYHKDNLGYNKPDPRALLQITEDLQLKPEETAYVGDSIVDGECALNAGMDFIAVLTGGSYPEDFQTMGADSIVDSVADLPAFLNEGGD